MLKLIFVVIALLLFLAAGFGVQLKIGQRVLAPVPLGYAALTVALLLIV